MRGLKNCIWFVSRPSHSEDFILIPLMVMSQHYTHTAQHRHSVCIYHSQHWLHGPYSGGEPAGGNKTGGPVGSGDTSLISTSVWPPQCIGVLIYGLPRPMRWGKWSTALRDGIKIFVLDLQPQDSPPLRLVISRWIACVHNQCQTLVSVLAPKRRITQVFTPPIGARFTSTAWLTTKQKL